MNITIRQNTRNFAITQYSGFFFGRGLVNIGGVLLGLKKDALCRIGGSETDSGDPIPATVVPGSGQISPGDKKVRSLHVDGKFGSTSALSVSYSMDDCALASSVEASLSRSSTLGGNGSGNLKYNGQRGPHGEHLTVKLVNTNGAFFRIESVRAHLVARGAR